MKFIRYSKFKGLDISSLNLGDLMESLSDSLLDSGYDDDYYWTRERRPQDTSLDALRRALLQALMDQGLLEERQIQEMLADNEGKFKGSLLEEMLNQLIERLVEEGYLKLSDEPAPQQTRPRTGQGMPEVSEPLPRNVKFELTEKGLDFLGYKTLRNLLGSFGKSSMGRHDTSHLSTGVEAAAASRPYEFGDTINLDVNTTLLSAIQREGLTVPLNLEYRDLHVHQCDYQSSCATVVMLDCSHSMILYGEDRFTPAKKVALALAHLIRTQYPGDSLKIVLFHDSAEELPLAKLATTQVGPYHTNTAEGLRLARRILQSQGKEMKQIVMVTDGKPTACFVEGVGQTFQSVQSGRKALDRHDRTGRNAGPTAGPTRRIYKNSMGGDPFVMEATFKEVQGCRKAGIMINTFMLASDFYLVEFVKQMCAMTDGKAYFANPDNLSQFVLMDFLRRRTSRVK
ncbi:MAG TPA: VWA domain-containing protein [Pyrinomonadaceae bacterium]|jgi:Ca-activated chloride channel family protein|nr:VWA domain-containing protein [Pyrinomonadaceae bacterium]